MNCVLEFWVSVIGGQAFGRKNIYDSWVFGPLG